ncbi:MAG: GMC family oxidoreductase [Acidimicrobiales bacterium]
MDPMYDYVIVGAGAAGAALANRLSQDPYTTVALLEAGPAARKLEITLPAAFAKLFGTRYDWDYRTDPQAGLAGRELRWPRGRTLGGSTAINAQMWVRGCRADYTAWEAVAGAQWGFEAARARYQRIERSERGANPWRGGDGPLPVSEQRDPNPMTLAFLAAAQQCGIARSDDVNGPRHEGVDLTQVTQRRGRRVSAADAYLTPARRRPNLTVVTSAQATGVLFDGRTAIGVAYRRRSAPHAVAARREVILCGGAVNTPQLLLLSGIGPAAQLRSLGLPVLVDSPEVGENLADHLAAGVVALNPPERPSSLVGADSPRQLLRWLLTRRGPLSSNVAEALAFVRTDPALPAADLELLFAPAPFLDHGQTEPPGHGLTVGAILLQPTSRGALRLRSSDPLVAPAIAPNYLSDPGGADLATLVAGVKLARRVLAAPALAGYVGEELLPGAAVQGDDAIAAYVRARAETLYHPVGTARMGRDEASVVDPELRVRGVEGLRVADASVMPALNRGHTMAPAVLIGETAADLILGRAAAPRPGSGAYAGW